MHRQDISGNGDPRTPPHDAGSCPAGTAHHARPAAAGPAGAADLWLLFRCDDPDRAAANHCNRRLIAAAAGAGLTAAIVDPARVTFPASGDCPGAARAMQEGIAEDAVPIGGADRMAPSPHPAAGSGRIGAAPMVLLDGQPVRLPRAALQRSGARLGTAGHALLDRLGEHGVVVPSRPGASARAADKLTAARALATAGLPTPPTVALGDPPDALRLARRVGFPLVLKTRLGARGHEVRLCPDPGSLADAVAALGACASGGPRRIIAQRYVARSHGRDLRILVIDGVPVAAMLREARDDEFRANVALGGSARAVVPDPAAVALACRAAEALGLEIAAVDLLFDRAGPSICEVNTAPGFEALEAASGLDIAGAMIAHLTARLVVPGAAPELARALREACR